jgi:hypothetical protein
MHIQFGAGLVRANLISTHIVQININYMKAFWDIAPSSVLGVDRITLMMEAVRTPESSVYSRDYTALYPRGLSSSYTPP